MPHFLRRSKVHLAIAAGVMLNAGAFFVGADSSHHFGGVYSDGACAYKCSQLGQGSYTWEDGTNCCTCN